MSEEGVARNWRVEKVAREERLVRRGQVNRIKSEAWFLKRGLTVRLRGLKAHRQAAGLSQRQLAKMIGTNQTTISELEEGYTYRGAYIFTIRRLCEALEVTPADLICMYEAPEEGGEGGRRVESTASQKGWDIGNSWTH